jgi:hypothetical protein
LQEVEDINGAAQKEKQFLESAKSKQQKVVAAISAKRQTATKHKADYQKLNAKLGLTIPLAEVVPQHGAQQSAQQSPQESVEKDSHQRQHIQIAPSFLLNHPLNAVNTENMGKILVRHGCRSNNNESTPLVALAVIEVSIMHTVYHR